MQLLPRRYPTRFAALFFSSYTFATFKDDYDQIEYVEALRESCCYAFSGIIQVCS